MDLLLNVNVNVLLNTVLDAGVVPSLDGEDVTSIQRSCDLVLQSRIAGGGDNRIVEVRFHPRDRFRVEQNLRVEVESAAHISFSSRRVYADSRKALIAFRRASVAGIRVSAGDFLSRTVSVAARIGSGGLYSVGNPLLRKLHACACSERIAVGNTVGYSLRQLPIDVETDALNR